MLQTAATSEGIRFVYRGPSGQRVSVAGAFNDWSPDAHVLRETPCEGPGSGGQPVYMTTVAISAGRVAYRFIVDGVWVADPHNQLTEPNEFGELNSVVYSDGSGPERE